MELISDDDKAITFRMRQREFGVLLGILRTFDVEFEKIDKELLMLEDDEVKGFIEDVFSMSEKVPLSGERNVIK